MAMNYKIIAAEFQLPEEIIQHIQSYMRGREAAHTTLLNKYWHRAWLTRPNLDFDEDEFQRGIIEFKEFAKKTMQRYEDLKLKINTFRLRVQSYTDDSLEEELIQKAIKLGATDLDIQISTSFVVPDEVLQSQTLTRLSISSCSIDLSRRRKKEVIITFPNLKSLNLSCVDVKGDLFGDLISRCPSIEELTLVNLMSSSDRLLLLPFDVAKLIKLHKLKYLELVSFDIGDSLFRSDSWPKFTCLKELVIVDLIGSEPNVRICSTSLERITVRPYIVNVEFTVTNLKKFVFNGYDLPFLGKSSREWEADVNIKCYIESNVGASWFSSLNQLAKLLGRSRVSLYIDLGCDQGDGYGYIGDGLVIPTVEKLTIMGLSKMSPAFLDALFCCCRPNFVWIPRQCMDGFERANIEEFPRLRSLPWEELLDAPSGLVRFELK